MKAQGLIAGTVNVPQMAVPSCEPNGQTTLSMMYEILQISRSIAYKAFRLDAGLYGEAPQAAKEAKEPDSSALNSVAIDLAKSLVETNDRLADTLNRLGIDY